MPRSGSYYGFRKGCRGCVADVFYLEIDERIAMQRGEIS
jgi:hypothetical protein